ncbi:MAG: hypothetical protein AAF601_06830 [Pseudomonadota bacterium]
MIGVILWSDPTKQTAVVWCEDHGNLAYLSQPHLDDLSGSFVDAGDVIEFDMTTERSQRQIGNVRLLAQASGMPLVNSLRQSAEHDRRAPADDHMGKIIPLPLNTVGAANSGASERLQRQG